MGKIASPVLPSALPGNGVGATAAAGGTGVVLSLVVGGGVAAEDVAVEGACGIVTGLVVAMADGTTVLMGCSVVSGTAVLVDWVLEVLVVDLVADVAAVLVVVKIVDGAAVPVDWVVEVLVASVEAPATVVGFEEEVTPGFCGFVVPWVVGCFVVGTEVVVEVVEVVVEDVEVGEVVVEVVEVVEVVVEVVEVVVEVGEVVEVVVEVVEVVEGRKVEH